MRETLGGFFQTSLQSDERNRITKLFIDNKQLYIQKLQNL